jgi:hypothetical protein
VSQQQQQQQQQRVSVTAAQVEQMQLCLALVASQPAAGQCMQVLSKLLGNMAAAPQVGGTHNFNRIAPLLVCAVLHAHSA